MALITEDGTGLVSAESYVSLADFDAFLVKRNLTTTSADAAKEAALREASSFIDQNYTFPLIPLRANQALAFPRSGTYQIEGRDIAGLPTRLVEAVCTLANEALAGALEPIDDSSQIKRVKEKVDVIETETEYAGQKGSRKFIVISRLMTLIGGRRRGRVIELTRS